MQASGLEVVGSENESLDATCDTHEEGSCVTALGQSKLLTPIL